MRRRQPVRKRCLERIEVCLVGLIAVRLAGEIEKLGRRSSSVAKRPAMTTWMTKPRVDALRRRMAELAALTDTAVDVGIPYERGDLVSRVHADGRIQETEHRGHGTRIKARVPVALAASLQQFSAS